MERFASLNLEEIERIKLEKDSENTHKATMMAYNVFKNYCEEKTIQIDTTNKQDLDKLLCNFYLEARKQNGDFYTQTSLKTIRFGLQRKFKQIDDTVDIIGDPAFSNSNTLFKAQLVQLKKKGYGKVEHKPSIAKEDLQKLYTGGIFSKDQPVTLQNRVFFDIMLHLCRRGRENLRELKTSSFMVKKLPDGVEYVTQVTDELTKNHRENDEAEDGGMMLATGTENCPVEAFKLYKSKLNDKLDVFFQKPKRSTPTDDGPWFDAQVVGIKTLDNKMKNISEKAELSELYTNHCIRATSISMLDDVGMEARHIMTVSGHKSESSIRSYSKTSLQTKRDMSAALSSSVSGPPAKRRNFSFGVPFDDEPVERSNTNASSSTSASVNPFRCDGNISFSNCTFNFQK